MFIRHIISWFSVRDYDAAKLQSAIEIATRYARGNISMQNGWYLDEAGLAKLSAAGDEAMEHINKKVPSA